MNEEFSPLSTADQLVYWTSSSGRIELEFLQSDIDNFPRHGNCEYFVSGRTEAISSQFNSISPKTLLDEAIQYGFRDYMGDDTPFTTNDVYMHLVWVALHDLSDNLHELPHTTL